MIQLKPNITLGVTRGGRSRRRVVPHECVELRLDAVQLDDNREVEHQRDVKLAAPELVCSALVRRPNQAVEEGQIGGGPSVMAARRFEPLGDKHAPQMVLELDALRNEELTKVQKRAALANFDFPQNAAELWRGSNHRARREILELVLFDPSFRRHEI